MKFFSDDIGLIFEPYNGIHLALILLVILGVVLIFRYRNSLRVYKYERRVAKIIAVSALIWEISLYAWFIGNGIWTVEHSLPIGLCAFTLYLAIFALYFKKYSLFAIGYFWTWGAIASVLFPDIPYSIDRFRFYQFMFGHLNFFFMYIYMIFVYKWYPTFSDWKKSCITLTIIVFILIATSNIFDINFMFMLNGAGTPFEVFEPFGYLGYLIGVILLSFSIIYIWYIPFMIYHKSHKNEL